MWTKRLFVILAVCVAVACTDDNQNEKNIENCLNQWAARYDKIQLVEESLSEIGSLDRYLVLKQGIDASGGGQYEFLLIGLTHDKGVLLHMGDSIKAPIRKNISVNKAKQIIEEGRSHVLTNMDSELSLEVNHVPCTFLKYYDESETGFEHRFSGLSNHMKGLHEFIQTLNIMTSELEANVEQDLSDPIHDKDQTKIQKFKLMLTEDNFFELQSL